MTDDPNVSIEEKVTLLVYPNQREDYLLIKSPLLSNINTQLYLLRYC